MKRKDSVVKYMVLSSLVLVPILVGIVLYKVPLRISKAVLLLIQGYVGVTVIHFLTKSHMNEYIMEILGGDNHLLYISLRGDRETFVLLALATLLFTAAFLYSINDDFFEARFIMLFLILQGTINGLFLTNDIFNLFVLFEVATIVVTILIMYRRDMRTIYDGIYYFVIQVVSMLFFLMGLAYMYRIFGVLSIQGLQEMMATGAVPRESIILPAAFMLAGIALKVGFFPMFSWVTRCYGTPSAPTAVLAIQSGLFVKINLFHLFRLKELFESTINFTNFFIVVAILTGIIGVIKALSQKHLKLILAYSTISQVGLISLGLLLGGVSATGSMYHMISHGILKVLLFLCAGMVVDAYGTNNVHNIRGVWKNMPVVAIAIMIGIAGITGFPFFNGTLSKYWIMEGTTNSIAIAAMWVLNTGTILTYLKFGSVLFGKEKRPVIHVQKSVVKIAVLGLLSVISLAGGVFAVQMVDYLFEAQVSISVPGMVEKTAIYGATVLIGIFLLRALDRRKLSLHYRFFGNSLSLSKNAVMLLVFFMALMMYGMFIR